jgi:hypothetical protein
MPPIPSPFAVGVFALVIAYPAGAMPPPDLVLPPAREASAEPKAPVAFRPGLWEIRHESKGGPMSNAPQVQSKCLDARALEADPIAPLKVPRTEGGRRGPRCSFGEIQIFEGQFTMPSQCQSPRGAVSIDWSGTHAAERFEMSATLRMGPMSMQMRTAGRRTGECPAP